jgi:hypothetical protein
LAHFVEALTNAAAGSPLFVVKIADDHSWLSLQRLIQRRHGNFARVRTNDGITVVATTAPDATAVSLPLAIEALAEALLKLALYYGRQKPISASASWRLHERRGGRYRRRGMAPKGSFTDNMRRAVEAGMRPQVSEGDFGKFGAWEFPAGWTQQQCIGFFAELRRPTVAALGTAARVG